MASFLNFLPSQVQCYFLFCYDDRRIPWAAIDCPRNQLVASARHRNLPSEMLQSVPFFLSFSFKRTRWVIAAIVVLQAERFRANQKQNKVEKWTIYTRKWHLQRPPASKKFRFVWWRVIFYEWHKWRLQRVQNESTIHGSSILLPWW